MNVTVFGATGEIGRAVVAKLLDDGHTVTAYVRNPGRLRDVDPRLAILTGELSDARRIRDSIRGTDAVMVAEHVDRYVGLATPSVPDRRDAPTLRARILPVVAGLLFPNALREIAA